MGNGLVERERAKYGGGDSAGLERKAVYQDAITARGKRLACARSPALQLHPYCRSASIDVCGDDSYATNFL